MAAAPAWGTQQIYLLQEQAAGPSGETQYKFRSIGSVDNARMVAVPQTGGHVLVLTAQGRVWAWGNNSQGQLAVGDTQSPDGWGEVAGHSLALKGDGTALGWGNNDDDQLCDPTVSIRTVPGTILGLSVGAANVTTTTTLRVAALADFNGDGSPDLIYQDPSTGASQIWFLSNATTVGITPFSGPNSWRIAGPK